MTDFSTTNVHATAGTSKTQETIASLTMLRMKREIDLKMIFDALGLDRKKDTAEEAVEIIKTLIDMVQGLR